MAEQTAKDAAGVPRRRGRRRGAADSRSEILAAAGREFAAKGYDSTSLRGIARAAGVDPALVHHYFTDKAELFAESLELPLRPDLLVAQILAGPREHVGENLVRMLLTVLEGSGAAPRAIGLMRTALGHDFAARMMRQFLLREVLHKVAAGIDVEDAELRATLVASQVVGLIAVRYGLQAEPLASAEVEELVARVGPVIQWHMVGFSDGIDRKPSPGE